MNLEGDKRAVDQYLELLEIFEDPTADKAVAFAKKYHPETANFDPINLLAGLHKTRVQVGTMAQATESAQWLMENKFRVDIQPRGKA